MQRHGLTTHQNATPIKEKYSTTFVRDLTLQDQKRQEPEGEEQEWPELVVAVVPSPFSSYASCMGSPSNVDLNQGEGRRSVLFRWDICLCTPETLV